ncbi:hypothetical protein BUALT_Bualt14G0105400 [Buddleja alternifolia]|uniref:Auxin-responsive protein n=1 Tax=Buddleja alternifolia TaxID=168488 RepID=A0AAV6WTS5_9LAMI|nr:hypothetical protein BUALT_Bualt14G0105400 [Buddleja alternifolia]
MAHESDLNFKATELRLGLPGTDESDQSMAKINNKRASPESINDGLNGAVSSAKSSDHETAPAPKAQIVGWPPVRSYRKNNIPAKKTETESGIYVKVSMDGAPYLRKIDLKVYDGYQELLKGLEIMFKFTIGLSIRIFVLIVVLFCLILFPGEYSEREGYKGSEYAPAYEDKDGDLMLVGDVPWE